MPATRTFLLLALTALLSLTIGAAGQTPALPPVPPAVISAEWSSIPLPAMPLGIVGRHGQLWVTGSHEMIATSSDGGIHWELRHLDAAGQLLFTLAFTGDRSVRAFGSDGVWLESDDGGVTWLRHTDGPMFGIYRAAFPTPVVGYISGVDQIAFTNDGGKSWKTHHWPGDSSYHRAYINGLSAPDALHASVLLPGKIMQTANAGHDWDEVLCPRTLACSSMRASHGDLIVYGDVSGSLKAKREATAQQASYLLSGDGTLTPGPVPLGDYRACTDSGCAVSEGWVDLQGAQPQAWAIPADPASPLSNGWATSGDSLCRISTTLRCRLGHDPWQAPPYPSPPDLTPPALLVSPDPKYPDQDRPKNLEGDVLLQGVISTDGRVHQAIVTQADEAAFAANALAAIAKWKFRPATGPDGHPQPVTANIEVHFRIRR